MIVRIQNTTAVRYIACRYKKTKQTHRALADISPSGVLALPLLNAFKKLEGYIARAIKPEYTEGQDDDEEDDNVC